MKEIRTRFAPSPTGAMHIGNLRTALYAYLIAKKDKGIFVVRIEDTDQNRFIEGSLEKILQALEWCGINNDEGVMFNNHKKVIEKGNFGPYFQSKRLDIYKKYIEKLLVNGHAYHCFCSKERLVKLREKQVSEKKPPKYDKCCLNLPKEDVRKKIETGEKFVIRLNVPQDKIISFKDEVYGKISIKGDSIDDQVLIKSDGFPTYHFAVVIDDHLMKISHVVRGEDWLPSAPKHVLLHEFLEFDLPTLVHVPNILGENKKKLSKREGDMGVDYFRKKGYLPEAIVNFIVLLGWNPKTEQEYFSLEQLAKIFDVSGLNKAGAILDIKKLDWMNAHYIKETSDETIFRLAEKYLKEYFQEIDYSWDEDLARKIVAVEKSRIKRINEITNEIDFYFKSNDYDPNLLNWKDNIKIITKKNLEKAFSLIDSIDNDEYELENIEKILLEEAGDKKGDFLWPLRFALTSQQKSPSPFEVAWAIGKEETKKRIKKAIRLL